MKGNILKVMALILSALLILTAFAGCAKGSEGLQFISNGDGTCAVSGIGSCTDTKVVIPTTSPTGDKVTSIGWRAFFDCTSLTRINYSGTKAQWNEISESFACISDDTVKIYCTDGTISKPSIPPVFVG